MLVRALTGTALAACSDVAPTAPAVTAPLVPAQASAPTARPAKPGTLVLRRTTSPARGGGARARTARRETWSIAEASLTKRGGAIVLGARPGSATTPERPASAPPTAVLELPARAASAVCDNAPAWRRETRTGGLTIVTRGQGDEPWSTVETWSEGRLLSRSRSVWERRRASWQLVSHEDAAVDGATQTLAVDRSGVRRASDDVTVPRVRCRDASAQIVPAAVAGAGGVASTAANGLAATLQAPLGSVGSAGLELTAAMFSAAEECAPGDDGEAACAVLMAAVVGATAAVVGASAGVWAGCFSPAVVVVATCTTALAALTSASAALAVATDAYQECRDKRFTPAPCSCPATPTSPAQLVSPVAALAAQDGAPRPRTAPFSVDCSQPPPPTDGGGGGGGGGGDGGDGGGHWVEICVNTDYYDEYGNYLYTVEEGCWVERLE